MSTPVLSSGLLDAVFVGTLLVWLVAAGLALLVRSPTGRRVTYALGVLGDVGALVVAISVLLGGTLDHVTVPAAAVGTFVFGLFGTGAAFLLLSGIAGLLTHWYCLGRARASSAPYLPATLSLLPVALAVLFVSQDVFSFVLSWEAMSLLTYLAVFTRRDDDAPLSAYLFVGLNEAGVLAVIVASAVLYAHVGSTSFAAIHAAASTVSTTWRSVVFVLVLVGFGVKAGLVPFHVWPPRAYRVSPNRANAFLATAVEAAGLFGIFQYVLWLLGPGPEWWGLLAVALGGVSALLGALYALVTHDLDGVLAYSSVENMGLTVIGVGAGLVFAADGLPAYAGLAYLVALLHALNHTAFKAMLFLATDAVADWAGTTTLDDLGSLARALPVVTVAFVASAAAISAMPPFNGVVSEWLLFQVLFQSVRLDPGIGRLTLQVAGAALALTGGLVLATFVRASGVGFLSDDRTPSTETTRADGGRTVSTTAKSALLGGVALCLLLGLFPVLVVSPFADITSTLTSASIGTRVVVANVGLVPIDAGFAEASPFWAAIAATVIALLGYALVRVRRRSVGETTSDLPVWTNGVEPRLERHQYSGIGMSVPLVSSLTSFYRARHAIRDGGENELLAEREYEFEFLNVFQAYLYQPIVRAGLRLNAAAKPLQSGNVNWYVGYILVFLLLTLVYLAFV